MTQLEVLCCCLCYLPVHLHFHVTKELMLDAASSRLALL